MENMKTRLQGVLFDYDGTIANTDLIHLDCWNFLLAKFRVSIDKDFYSLNCVGATSDHIAARIAGANPDAGLSPANLAADKDALYEEWMNTKPAPLLPGVSEILGWLSGHDIAAAIVTGAPLAAIVRTLENHGIARHFRVLITREDITIGKPSPQGYLLGLKRLQMSAISALALEDTVSGVQAAKAAGLLTCAIPQALTRDHDFSSADVVCSDLNHVVDWINEQFLEACG